MPARTPRTGGGVTNTTSSPAVIRGGATPTPVPSSARPPRPQSAVPASARSGFASGRRSASEGALGSGRRPASAAATRSARGAPAAEPPGAAAASDRPATATGARRVDGATFGARRHEFEHRVTALEELYVGRDLIAPAWLRVSTTPWTGLKAATGGYGREVHGTSISAEFPAFAHIAAVDGFDIGGATLVKRTRPPPKQPKMKTATSADSPDWFQTTATRAWKTGKYAAQKHRAVVSRNQVLLEPLQQSLGADSWCFRDTFNWNSARNSQPVGR